MSCPAEQHGATWVVDHWELPCPKCGEMHRVAPNVIAVACNYGHARAAYEQHLPSADGLVYPVGFDAWLSKAREIVEAILDEASIVVGEFRQMFDDKLSPADAVYRVFRVHL